MLRRKESALGDVVDKANGNYNITQAAAMDTTGLQLLLDAERKKNQGVERIIAGLRDCACNHSTLVEAARMYLRSTSRHGYEMCMHYILKQVAGSIRPYGAAYHSEIIRQLRTFESIVQQGDHSFLQLSIRAWSIFVAMVHLLIFNIVVVSLYTLVTVDFFLPSSSTSPFRFILHKGHGL